MKVVAQPIENTIFPLSIGDLSLDFIAAYVIPADAWYILPLAATNRQPDILLTPHRKNSKYSPYHEAWHLLQGE